jgi:hypothetical protein
MLDSEKVNEILKGIKVQELEDLGIAERHGSYERTWSITMRDDLSRFLTVAITPVESPERPRIEVWIGADNGERFRRELVSCFERVDLTRPDLEPLKSELQNAINHAEWAVFRISGLDRSDRPHTRFTTPTVQHPSLVDGLGQEP